MEKVQAILMFKNMSLSKESDSVLSSMINLLPLERFYLICSLLESEEINLEIYFKLKFLIDYFGVSLCSINCMKKIKSIISDRPSKNVYLSRLIQILERDISLKEEVIQSAVTNLELIKSLFFALYLETQSARDEIPCSKISYDFENNSAVLVDRFYHKIEEILYNYFSTPLFPNIFTLLLDMTFIDLDSDKNTMHQIDLCIEQYNLGTR